MILLWRRPYRCSGKATQTGNGGNGVLNVKQTLQLKMGAAPVAPRGEITLPGEVMCQVTSAKL